MQTKLLGLLVLFGALISLSSAKYSHAVFQSTSEWVYLDKFCFDTTGPGHLYAEILSLSPAQGWNLVTFFDEDWDKVEFGNLKCEDRLNFTRIVPWPVAAGENVTVEFDEHVRPYYWYLVAVNCGNTAPFEMEWQAWFLQFDNNNNKQFSFDEQGLMALYIVYFVFFLLALPALVYFNYQYWKSDSYHPIIKWATSVVVLQLFSVMFNMIHYAQYAKDGYGSPGAHVLGQLLDMVSNIILILLLVLIAKGWGISVPSLKNFEQQRYALGAMFLVFLILYIVLYMVSIFAQNPARVQYNYETAAGIVLLVVRFLTWGFFGWSIYKSAYSEVDTDKKHFYYIFGAGYSVWFLIIPLMVIIGVGIPEYTRLKAVESTYLTFNVIALAGLLFMLWPSRVKQFFQHVASDLLAQHGYERL